MKVAVRQRITAGALLAVVGPGLLAGLSDDDPAGITTYSVLGAEHGYQLLWVLLLCRVPPAGMVSRIFKPKERFWK